MNDAVAISVTSVQRPRPRSGASIGAAAVPALRARVYDQAGWRSGNAGDARRRACSCCRRRTVRACARRWCCPSARSSICAVRLRGGDGVAIGEVFAFVSGLYFKGKLAYALAFARPPEPGTELVGSGALVITPTAGLRPAETAVTAGRASARSPRVDIAANDPRYRAPLARQRPRARRRDRSRVRRRPARQHRLGEVRGRADRGLRRAAALSRSISSAAAT